MACLSFLGLGAPNCPNFASYLQVVDIKLNSNRRDPLCLSVLLLLKDAPPKFIWRLRKQVGDVDKQKIGELYFSSAINSIGRISNASYGVWKAFGRDASYNIVALWRAARWGSTITVTNEKDMGLFARARTPSGPRSQAIGVLGRMQCRFRGVGDCQERL